MKKYYYIAAFMVLGYLLSLLIHAFIEFPLLALMSQSYAEGEVTWLTAHWATVHRFGGLALSFGGLILGYLLGRHFWHILYVEKRYGTPRW